MAKTAFENRIISFFETETFLSRRIAFDELSREDFLNAEYYEKTFLGETNTVDTFFMKDIFTEMKKLHSYGQKEYLKQNIGLTTKEVYLLKTEIPFFDHLLPFCGLAIKQLFSTLTNHNIYSQLKYQSLRQLFKTLSFVCSQIIFVEFDLYRNQGNYLASLLQPKRKHKRSEYIRFTEWYYYKGHKKIFKKYKPLIFFCKNAIQNWINNQSNLYNRLAVDIAEISVFFKISNTVVTHIDFAVSDTHNGGLSTAIIHFPNDSIVYKPKDLSIDKAYNEFLDWLSIKYFTKCASYKVLNKGSYGYAEFLQNGGCSELSEVRRYYESAGSLLAILYYLGATDCHFENVISNKENIHIVDAETIIHPQSAIFFDTLESIELNVNILRLFSDSVLSVGLLPHWQFNKVSETVYDVSGLGQNYEQYRPGATIKWIHLNSDAIRQLAVYEKIEQQKNLVVLKGQPVSPIEYINEICSGFKHVYCLIMENKKTVNDKVNWLFFNKKIRFLFRPTSFYNSILRNIVTPKVMHDPILLALELENLCKLFLRQTNRTEYWQLYKSEVIELLTLNIPAFYSKSNENVIFNTHVKLNNLLESTAIDRISVRSLSNHDLDMQLQIINASFQANSSKHRKKMVQSFQSSNACTATGRSLIESIPVGIVSKGIHDNGSLRWIGLTNLDQTECLQIQPLSYSFYQGSLGIAFMLAEYASYSNNEAFRKHAVSAVNPLLQLVAVLNAEVTHSLIRKYNIGIGNGIGSFIYGLIRLHKRLADSNLIECCFKLMEHVKAEHIQNDNKHDLLSGASGLLVAILKLYETSKIDKCLNFAIAIGDYLLQKRVASQSWQTINDTPISGFAHGTSGIAYALFRLYIFSNLSRFKDASLKAIEYENTLLSSKRKNWKDIRRGAPEKYKAAWCHGAVGIGLSRLFISRFYKCDYIERDIQFALESILSYPIESVDHICCGNFGRLEFLFEYGRQYNRMDIFQSHYDAILQRIARTGILLNTRLNSGFDNPVLFKGLAGIEVQLIRFSQVSHVESLLLFE